MFKANIERDYGEKKYVCQYGTELSGFPPGRLAYILVILQLYNCCPTSKKTNRGIEAMAIREKLFVNTGFVILFE